MMDDGKLREEVDLSSASLDLIELLLDEASGPDLFAEIARSNTQRPEILRLLIEHPDTPPEVRQQIAGILRMPLNQESAGSEKQHSPEERSQTILQRIQKLSISERLQLALKGGKEIRSILLRDPNKEITLNVLDNPKLTETEIEMIAKSRSVADEALRKISKKREWMKNYNILQALVTNPKTPPAISLSLVSDLKTRDLALLGKNKNVSEGVRAMAKKLLKARLAH